jgi:hypothetical protein
MNAIVRWSLTAVVVVGLAIDAVSHLDVAHNYVYNATSTVSEATLFRVEAGLALAAALALIVWASRWTFAASFAIATGGLVLLVLYRYCDVGKVGPLPDMYEPTWDVPGKKWSVVGEIIAILGSVGLLSASVLGAGRRTRQSQNV